MKLKSLSKVLWSCVIGSLLFAGCYRIDLAEISDEISLPSSLAIPLGNARISLNKLIDKLELDDMINIEQTESDINLKISESVDFSFKQIELSNTSFEPLSFTYDFDNLPPGYDFQTSGSLQHQFTIQINSTPTEERIDSVILSTFKVELSLPVLNEVEINKLEVITEFEEESVVQLDANGNVVAGKVTRTFRPTSGATSTTFIYQDIKVKPNSNNELNLLVTVKTVDNQMMTFNSNSKIGFQYEVQEVDYEIAYGKFPAAIATRDAKQQPIDLSMLDGMRFANPQLNISLESNIGTYLRFNIDTIRAYREGDVENAVFAKFNGKHDIHIDVDERPMKPGDIITKKLDTFDRNNGEIDKLFDTNPTPNVLDYIFSVGTYEKPGETAPQFLTKDAELSVLVEGIIPLHFKKDSYIEMKDTMNIGLDSLFNDNDILEEATLRLTIENGLPLDIDLKIADFLNEKGNSLTTSIEKDYLIKAPEVNADGTVKTTSKQKIDIKLTKAQFEEISKADRLVYNIKAHQEQGQEIHFRPQDFFDIRLGIFVKGDISTATFSNDDN